MHVNQLIVRTFPLVYTGILFDVKIKRLCCSLFCLQFILILFTEDVTPPSLQWVGSTPSQTNGSIILSWTTDEAVTSLCTVHSPVKATDVSCNNKWVGTELRHGEYSLAVKMVDGSGNKAQAVHRWNNSKSYIYIMHLQITNIIHVDLLPFKL